MKYSLYGLRRRLGGHLAKTQIDTELLLEFFSGLRPVETGWELRRIGNRGDGGYLVPDDLLDIAGCISPGVSEMMDFELQLSKEFNIPSALYDASIEVLPYTDQNIKFHKLFVGNVNKSNYLPLSKTLDDFPNSKEASLVLQMDIEGDELIALGSLEESDLNKFRILVVEFHRLQDWQNQTVFQKLILPLFTRISDSFDIVHLHPNNCDGVFYVGGKTMPRALEITFHHKSRRKSMPSYVSIPHSLDNPNSSDVPDIRLDL
jgi:hypothetical protein